MLNNKSESNAKSRARIFATTRKNVPTRAYMGIYPYTTYSHKAFKRCGVARAVCGHAV